MSNAVEKPKSIREVIEQPAYQNRLKEILRDRAPQFAASIVQVVGRSFFLQKCRPESVIGAAITAAALDLSLDPNLGEAHLVPYGAECQFQLGYRGLVQLGQRSGQYRRMGWKVIYEDELVKWDELKGELVLNEKYTSDKVIGYAAYFSLVNGFERYAYWTVERVRNHAERFSKAFQKKKEESLWTTAFDTMALKTVLKDLIGHWGPKSVQMQRAFEVDQMVFQDSEKGQYRDNEPAGPTISKPLFGGAADERTASPKDVLAERMKESGMTFDELRAMVIGSTVTPAKVKKAADLWTSLDDISLDDATFILEQHEIYLNPIEV